MVLLIWHTADPCLLRGVFFLYYHYNVLLVLMYIKGYQNNMLVYHGIHEYNTRNKTIQVVNACTYYVTQSSCFYMGISISTFNALPRFRVLPFSVFRMWRPNVTPFSFTLQGERWREHWLICAFTVQGTLS